MIIREIENEFSEEIGKIGRKVNRGEYMEITISEKQKEELMKEYEQDYKTYLTSGGGELTIYFMGTSSAMALVLTKAGIATDEEIAKIQEKIKKELEKKPNPMSNEGLDKCEEKLNEIITRIKTDFLRERKMLLQDQIEIYRCWIRDLHKFLGIEGNEPKLMRDLLCEMEQKGDVK